MLNSCRSRHAVVVNRCESQTTAFAQYRASMGANIVLRHASAPKRIKGAPRFRLRRKDRGARTQFLSHSILKLVWCELSRPRPVRRPAKNQPFSANPSAQEQLWIYDERLCTIIFVSHDLHDIKHERTGPVAAADKSR